MDLDDFRVFLAIYKHGSISKAAASLYMAKAIFPVKYKN